tara:strand:+ start:2918 stop:4066 length:1149 start_codon:yes stop_codon:yes gene_type:complete
MTENISIKKIIKTDSTLDILWNDNQKSNFHFMWLRDNCPTAHDKDTRHRMFNILKVSKSINPKEYSIKEDGKLKIEWSEGNHISYYEPNWLRNNCYTIKNKKPYISPYKLWNHSLQNDLNKISIDHNEIINTDEALIRWLELLHEYGISIVKNAPTEKNSLFPVLNRISHTRETFFKTPFEVINIVKKPNNSAYTAHALRNHLDLPYFETPPGYQFLHCLINNSEGGMSSAVDGFAVAEYLRKNEKDVFDILTRVPLIWKDNDWTQETIRIAHSTPITLTKDKDYNDIRFSVANMDALDCHPNIMEQVYEAHHKFGTLLHDDKFNIKFNLEPGDIFSFNNRRVLHGRTAFNPNSGNRHLQGYYMDRDEIIGRLNFFKDKKNK